MYPEKVSLVCKQCGNEFAVNPSHVVNKNNGSARLYCSRKCKGLAGRGEWKLEDTNKIEYTCLECGKKWYDKLALKDRKKYCSRICGGVARIRKLCGKNPTSIEIKTLDALTTLGIENIPQHRMCGRWVVDFFLPEYNTIVECQGDFHHCNPAVFPDGAKYAIQRRTMERDIRRGMEFTAAGYHIIELWESDINKYGAESLLRSALNIH